MIKNKMKLIAGLLSVVALSGAIIPSTSVLAAEKMPVATIDQEQSSYVLNEENENYNKAIEYLEANGNEMSVQYFQEYFYGKTVTANNQDELMDGYFAFLATKPGGKIALETILGIVASAMAIVSGMYNAGRYAAKQCVSRGILTKKSYKPNGGWIMAGITVAFGLPAALGFDDYMYDR
ncbi:hypothetical protein UA3_02596 [Enterococcus faecium EnGen0263]|uniref:hypothetical protein n=1 Tax=Enterococcus faecium TaxID=1352 RepID=UPI00032EEF38|nr:hypothetical protein [Enterococcus faecium]EOH52470.1 hypothetical protein UA3_02596 [Enterococcus faecium EnGen0263]